MEIKAYTVNTIKKLENKTISYDFPVMYANGHYFDSLQSVMDSYGIILSSLSEHNYDIDAYLKDIIENPMISASYRESNFNVNKDEYSTVDAFEVLQDKEDNCVGQVYYVSKAKVINFCQEDEKYEYDSILHIALGNIDIYFNGSSCFIDDRIKNRQIQAYLD